MYIYLVRHGNHQDVFLYGFRRRLHPLFLRRCFLYGFHRRRKHFFMVSVVGFLWFPSWQENIILWFPSLDFWWILPPQEDPKS